jgi:hypothetical protein
MGKIYIAYIRRWIDGVKESWRWRRKKEEKIKRRRTNSVEFDVPGFEYFKPSKRTFSFNNSS